MSVYTNCTEDLACHLSFLQSSMDVNTSNVAQAARFLAGDCKSVRQPTAKAWATPGGQTWLTGINGNTFSWKRTVFYKNFGVWKCCYNSWKHCRFWSKSKKYSTLLQKLFPPFVTFGKTQPFRPLQFPTFVQLHTSHVVFSYKSPASLFPNAGGNDLSWSPGREGGLGA